MLDPVLLRVFGGLLCVYTLLCDDDAQDAYQRGLEIYLHRLDRVDPATAGAFSTTASSGDEFSVSSGRSGC